MPPQHLQTNYAKASLLDNHKKITPAIINNNGKDNNTISPKTFRNANKITA